MIRLHDTIEINSTPSQLFTWLSRIPDAYTSWHPDHVACRVIQGSMLEVGSELEFEEYLHGKLHTLRFRMTRVIPDRRMEFEIMGMGRGTFEVEGSRDTVRFIAGLEIGSDRLIIGRLIDLIFSSFFSRRIEAMKQHMVEEGQNLKAILESGSPVSASQEGVVDTGGAIVEKQVR